MKDFVLYAFAVLLFLALPVSTNANTSVSVSNDSGSSKISVDSSTNSSVKINSSSNTSSHTSIRIESNGEVKTYESDKPEDVNMQSDDGSVKVNVNNHANNTFKSNGNSYQNFDEEEIKPSPEVEVSPQPSIQPTEIKKETRTWLERIREIFRKIFALG